MAPRTETQGTSVFAGERRILAEWALLLWIATAPSRRFDFVGGQAIEGDRKTFSRNPPAQERVEVAGQLFSQMQRLTTYPWLPTWQSGDRRRETWKLKALTGDCGSPCAFPARGGTVR